MKKVGAILIIGILFLFSFMVYSFALNYDEISDGEFIEYGSYPQTHITDSEIIDELNGLLEGKEWNSMGFCADNKPADYAVYCDVDLNGQKYRAVCYSGTRPVYATSSVNGAGYQVSNGYPAGTVYWFSYDPIEWIVADKENGMLISAKALGSQAINDIFYKIDDEYYLDEAGTVYANNYAESSIRTKLNGDFYDNAFSAKEKAMIKTVQVENKAYFDEYSQYSSATTYDKVFLPSLDDINNASYEFETDSFRMLLTDYARMEGYSDYSANGIDYVFFAYWFLRTPGTSSKTMLYFDPTGNCYTDIDSIGCDTGIVPCICVDFSALTEDDGIDPENGLSYSYEDDVLTISYYGEGEAPAVSSTTTLAEYSAAKALITDDNIDRISSNAFSGFDALQTVVFGGNTVVDSNAFSDCISLRDVFCRKALTVDEYALPLCDVYIKSSDPLINNSADSLSIHRVTFDEGTLRITGAVTMDTYRLFDLIAAFCGSYDNIYNISFESFISTDIEFSYYDEQTGSLKDITDTALKNAVLSVRTKNADDYVQISFNEMSKKAADGTLGEFVLTVTANGYGDINEEPIVIETEENFFRQAIKFIVTMLNKLFSLFSKLFK